MSTTPLEFGTISHLRRTIMAVEGVYPGTKVDEVQVPNYMLGRNVWEVVVDLALSTVGGSMRAWPSWATLEDLEVILNVEEVVRETMPVGVPWHIKQKDELMGKDGELPTLSELAKKVPDVNNQVMELMDHLDLWTVRSMQVKKDKQGKVESVWVPGLAPEEAKPRGLENLTVMLLEFCIPSRNAERFTTLARSISSMTSKLGREGSLTGTLEETVRDVTKENEELRWAAAAYKEMADEAVEALRDCLAVEQVTNKLTWTQTAVALLQRINEESLTNVGAVFAKRFARMESAVNERRPDLAAELIRQLDEDE